MCAICMRTPCLPQCPNAEEPERVYTCHLCKEPVYAGDRYIEKDDGKILCKYCFESMTQTELLEELGIDIKTAEGDEWT